MNEVRILLSLNACPEAQHNMFISSDRILLVHRRCIFTCQKCVK